ncbi:MAG: hypothetical protein R3257_07510 [bacterium]|nr:hypothetical protein [bacterium]
MAISGLSQGEAADQILELVKELVPGLDPLKIQAEAPLQPQLGVSLWEFKKLGGMLYDLTGTHLPPEMLSGSSSLMDLIDAIRNSGMKKP